MSDNTNSSAQSAEDADAPTILRNTIATTRHFLTASLAAARKHSPLADDKVEAADNAVAGVIHTGYQAVKRIAVYGNPTVILSIAAVAGAVPSLPFGPRAIVRNAVLTSGLAAIMIYPDHLRKTFMSTDPSRSSTSS